VDTVRITGTPRTIRLKPNFAKVIHAKWERDWWTLYVDPKTYLPVRMTGGLRDFGGSAPPYTSTDVTRVRWLRPTAANMAKTLVPVPPGFRHVSSPDSQ
jgi:hypothetical protein